MCIDTTSSQRNRFGKLFFAVTLCVQTNLSSAGDALSLGQEQIDDNETYIAEKLIEAIKEISLKRHPSGTVMRFNQAKTLGCVDARFKVADDIAPALRQGLFAGPGTYPATIRFANASQFDDNAKDFRGMSIKLFGVKGESLWGESGELDFVLNSHPALFAADPDDFYDFVAAILKGRRWQYFMNPTHIYSLLIVLRGRQRITSPFDIKYFSTTPYRFGNNSNKAVKYAAAPCSEFNSEIPESADKNYLTTAMQQHLSKGEACFDFMVQFQEDTERMPIEDASVAWDESASPFLRVARITIQRQNFRDLEALARCEQMSFNPWRTLVEHKPLGGINRVRRSVYAEMAAFRTAQNASR